MYTLSGLILPGKVFCEAGDHHDRCRDFHTQPGCKSQMQRIPRGLCPNLAGKSFMSLPRHWVPQYLRLFPPPALHLPFFHASGSHPDYNLCKKAFSSAHHKRSRVGKKKKRPSLLSLSLSPNALTHTHSLTQTSSLIIQCSASRKKPLVIQILEKINIYIYTHTQILKQLFWYITFKLSGWFLSSFVISNWDYHSVLW